MIVGAISFLLGIVALQYFAVLPDSRWCLTFPLMLALFYFIKPLRYPLLFLSGFLWSLGYASWQLNDQLRPDMEGVDVTIEGLVTDLPETQGRRIKFNFLVEQFDVTYQALSTPKRLRLSWYGTPPALRAGERWQLTVRLKRPHGYSNPGGFDYERWLFHNHIHATGYVRAKGENHRLSSSEWMFSLGAIRQTLSDKLHLALAGRPYRGIISALAIGDRSDIDQDQWNVLTATGTNHLMAISGLHIGLVAGLMFFMMKWLWARVGRLSLWLPAPRAAAIGGLAGALFYSALAGFSIPTQRALVMVAVAMIAVFMQRSSSSSTTLAVALFVVLIWDPLSVLSPGFWLSFGAVAIIIYTVSRRITNQGIWWKWGRIQWILAVGLAPLLVLMFQKISLVAPLANIVAVPLVGLLVVPVVLLGTILLLVLPVVAVWLLDFANVLLHILWWLLDGLAGLTWSTWTQHQPPVWAVLCAVVGVIILLAPRGIPLRWFGVIWFLPVILIRAPIPSFGEAWFTLLDVGQGLSAVVRTQNHTLVYDTGPRFGSNFNTGDAVITPFLWQAGIQHVDTMIIGHGDNDHVGGAYALDQRLLIDSVITSDQSKISWRASGQCIAGQRWLWDGVVFDMLHPPLGLPFSDNNRSCVLRIQAGENSVILTGDIEKQAESYLVKNSPQSLTAQVLVVPHHGSNTSSTMEFITAIQPDIGLIPTGYRNRYGFPKKDVVDRLERAGVQLFDSARHGAITLTLGRSDAELDIHTFRQENRNYWHWRD